METVQSRDGTTIAFDRVGEGPAIVFVAGAIQHRAIDQTTPDLAALLAPRYSALIYDRRGRGDSGETAPYAVEREVEDLAAVVEAAGGEANLFGMSSGAALAIEAAAAGVPIGALALYEPPFRGGNGDPGIPDDYVAQLDELAASGRRGDAVEYFMTKAVGLPAQAVAPMRAQPSWAALEAIAHTIAYDGRIMTDDALLAERAPAVDTPALVIDGGDSPAWMRAAADRAADALPNAQRRTLAGQTHQFAPDTVAPVLEEFFAVY
jgi:pimeloyl-ACP methyl ester carboxylesterase